MLCSILLLLLAIGFAALVPILPCPEHSNPTEETSPCLQCNGHGRATLFQHWNTLRYERQREQVFRQWQI